MVSVVSVLNKHIQWVTWLTWLVILLWRLRLFSYQECSHNDQIICSNVRLSLTLTCLSINWEKKDFRMSFLTGSILCQWNVIKPECVIAFKTLAGCQKPRVKPWNQKPGRKKNPEACSKKRRANNKKQKQLWQDSGKNLWYAEMKDNSVCSFYVRNRMAYRLNSDKKNI